MKLELLDEDCKTLMVLPKVGTVLFFEGGIKIEFDGT